MAPPLKPWTFDLRGEKTALQKEVAWPPGYNPSALATQVGSNSSGRRLYDLPKAMEVAMAPGKSLAMNAFMMWMSGSSPQIFSIMITGMSLMTPLKQLVSVQKVFKPLEDGKVDLTVAKLIFVALNVFGLATALYKCGTMGLLPLTSADWAHYLPHKHPAEASGVPLQW
ncbi:unnamed protein product [Phaeothamnion confervicola]